MKTLRRALAMVSLSLSALPAAAGATTTIDFDTYPGGSPVPAVAGSVGDQWKSLGVIFSDQSGGPASASNNSCSLSAPNHAYAPTIVATFVDPATGTQALTAYVGTAQDKCWVPGEGIAIRAYDINGNLVGSVFNPSSGPGGGHFEALGFSSAIVARVEMDCIGQGIDDFVFDPPTVLSVVEEPIAFAMRPLVNPSFGGRLTVAFSLASSNVARLELMDVCGRRVAAREVGSFGPGHHHVRLGEDRLLPSGLYFVRLSQGSDVIMARVAILD